MCFLLNIAPPPACLPSRTPPSSPSSHLLSYLLTCCTTGDALPLLFLLLLHPPSFSSPLSAKGFGILTSSLFSISSLPRLDVACGLPRASYDSCLELRPPAGRSHTRTQTCVPVGKKGEKKNTPLKNNLCVPSQKAPAHSTSSRTSLYFHPVHNLNTKDKFIKSVVNILEG